MKNYWSCSKFADWLRGTSKPEIDTLEGWDEWHQEAKEHRIRYWLAEEGLDYLQNIIYSPLTLVNAIRAYISNRFIVKTHALTSNLKPGSWYDLDVRLIECIFDELVNFVEADLALMAHWVLSDEERKKYKKPWNHRVFPLGNWRCPEAGIAYLNWASDLKYDENSIGQNAPRIGEPTPQALAAQEVLVLYQWWKADRPNRPDPHEVSGWDAHHKEKKHANEKNDPDGDRAVYEKLKQIEQVQEDEDTNMLIRLIKIRLYLWT